MQLRRSIRRSLTRAPSRPAAAPPLPRVLARAAAESARRHPRLARTLAGLVAALAAFLLVVPVPRFDRPVSAVLLARDGTLLSATTARDEQWRFPPRTTVPAKLAAALVAYEDRRFRWHPGVDLVAVGRALLSNARAGTVVSGASTITMQVVRLWRAGEPRTLGEKVLEALVAVRLELAASKDRILALYASHAPFGGNVVGIDAASWRYFGVAPEELSWAEAATLAVLPNSPALVHPGRARDVLLARRNRLLEALRAAGALDASTCAAALGEPLPPAPHRLPQLAPHLAARLGPRASGPVATTLDAGLQRRVRDIVARHHRELAGNEVHNAAVLVLEVESGGVLAYVGNVLDGGAWAHGGYVDVVMAPRSTGSILKPLLYAAALDAGELLPAELLEDTPLRVGGFAPENFTRTYAGAVPAAAAIARSLNVPAARLLQDYGVDRFYALLGRLGMTTLARPASDYGLSLILGGAEARLWEVTGIYASLARSVSRAARGEPDPGSLLPPMVEARPAAAAPAPVPLGPGASFVMLQAMLEVERPGVEASWREFARPRRIAWKTGTSFGFRDGWAVGVTPRHAVGVWVGNADGEGRPGLTGVGTAAPILFDVFAALPAAGWFEPPLRDLVSLEVCCRSGQRAGPHCTETELVDAPRAALDGRACEYCELVHLDASGRYRVHGDCEPVHRQRAAERFVLPPAMEWFYRMRHADYPPLPPWRPDCVAALGDASTSMSLLYPRREGAIYVPVELDGSRGRTVLEAAHRDPAATIYWHLDDAYLGLTRDLHQLAVAPAPGPHRLTLVDDGGGRLERRFLVLDKPE